MRNARFAPTGAAVLLTAEAFAVWALFALLPLAGGGRMREAWDVGGYGSIGLPVLLVSLAVAAALSEQPPWKLAAWTLFGHAAAMVAFSPPGNDHSLLPLAILFIGVPMFGMFFGAAWLGRRVGRLLRPADAG